MNRFAVGIVLAGIAASAAAFEAWSRPEVFKEATPAPMAAAIVNAVDNAPPQPLAIPAPTPTAPRPEEYFNVSALRTAGIELKNGKYSMVIFRHAQIFPAQDPFFLVNFSATFKDQPFGTVSVILPTENMSAGRLLSLIRKKLRVSIPEEDLGLITLSEALNTRGEANFYLNDNKSFTDQTFLVTRSGSKVLAMQFPDAYNERVAEFLPIFFQQ